MSAICRKTQRAHDSGTRRTTSQPSRYGRRGRALRQRHDRPPPFPTRGQAPPPGNPGPFLQLEPLPRGGSTPVAEVGAQSRIPSARSALRDHRQCQTPGRPTFGVQGARVDRCCVVPASASGRAFEPSLTPPSVVCGRTRQAALISVILSSATGSQRGPVQYVPLCSPAQGEDACVARQPGQPGRRARRGPLRVPKMGGQMAVWWPLAGLTPRSSAR